MLIFVMVGNVALSLISLVLAVRLFRLWTQTRQLPELLLGIAYFVGAFVGSTLSWIRQIAHLEGAAAMWLEFLNRGAAVVSCVMILCTAWRVFRPNAVWARVLVAVELIVFCTYLFRDQILGVHPILVLMHNPLYWCNTVGVTLPQYWIAAEAMAYQVSIRRRWRVGLPADMVVATQMLLWAIGMAAIGSLFPVLDVIRFFGGSRNAMMLPVSVLGLVNTVCLYLSFFMPLFVIRRLQLRSAPPAA
jgi:hypothetical protein